MGGGLNREIAKVCSSAQKRNGLAIPFLQDEKFNDATAQNSVFPGLAAHNDRAHDAQAGQQHGVAFWFRDWRDR